MNKILLIIILISISTLMYANEIVDLKFRNISPIESRIYPVDSQKQMTHGHFSLLALTQMSEQNYLVIREPFAPSIVENNLSARFKGVQIADNDIRSINRFNTQYLSFMASTITAGSLGLAGIITGAALLGRALTLSWVTYDYGTPDERTVREYYYDYLKIPGIITLSVSGAVFLLGSALFLPLLLVSYKNYKTVKTKLLNILNGTPLSYNHKNLRVGFDLRIEN